MGYLAQVEDIASNTVLYTFSKKFTQGDLGWARRSASVEIANADFAADPFGTLGAPLQKQTFQWTARILTRRNWDAAADAIAAAMGGGELQRFVWTTDSGKVRVFNGKVMAVGRPYRSAESPDFTDIPVTIEVNETWHERYAANQLIAGVGGLISGQTPTIFAGTNALVVNAASFTFTIHAEALGAGGVPTADDTTPIISISGPFGGDGGFAIVNQTQRAFIKDLNGNLGGPFIGIAYKIAAGESVVIDCGAKTIVLAKGAGGGGDITGATKIVPIYQPYWHIVKAGIANTMILACLGGNTTFDSTKTRIDYQWMRKFR